MSHHFVNLEYINVKHCGDKFRKVLGRRYTKFDLFMYTNLGV